MLEDIFCVVPPKPRPSCTHIGLILISEVVSDLETSCYWTIGLHQLSELNSIYERLLGILKICLTNERSVLQRFLLFTRFISNV